MEEHIQLQLVHRVGSDLLLLILFEGRRLQTNLYQLYP